VLAQAFTGLQKTAATVLQALFASDADSGLQATEQQVRSWLGSSGGGSSSSGGSSASVLHASSYKSSSASTQQHVLGGCEAHVGRGLLTLVADTQPGLEVSSDYVQLSCNRWLHGCYLCLAICRTPTSGCLALE
jgi:hypothetical protein